MQFIIAKISVPKHHKEKRELYSLKPNFLHLHNHIKKHQVQDNEENLHTEHFKHIAHQYHKEFKALSNDQKYAVRKYKGPDYTAINGYMRKGETTNPNVKKWAEHISDAINHFKTKTDMLAIRGIAARPEWIKENCVKGAVISDKGFMSVSTRPATVSSYATAKKQQDSNRSSVIMNLHIPKNTHVMPVSPNELQDKDNAHKENEAEYLVHANSHWQVHSVKHKTINGNPLTVLNMFYIPGKHSE